MDEGFRGDRLAARMAEMDITQVELSTKIGVDQSTISHWIAMRGREPGGWKLVRLAKALECSIDYLYGLTDDPAPHWMSPRVAAIADELRQTIAEHHHGGDVRHLAEAVARRAGQPPRRSGRTSPPR